MAGDLSLLFGGSVCFWGVIVFPQTVHQVKRFFKITAGFTLLVAGVVMIVLPGPVWLTIGLGLALLAAEYVWAQRLLNKLKASGERLRQAVLPSSNPRPRDGAAPAESEHHSDPVDAAS